MQLRECQTLRGEVLSVNHSAKSCRVVIEFRGSLASTAAIMKEATVELGIMAGAPVYAEVGANGIVLGVCHGDECALLG